MKEFKDNSIWVIDEFDSQKDIFLQIEIDKFIEETKDYISIFLKIYAGLKHKRFSKKFGFQGELEELRDHFSQIYRKIISNILHKFGKDGPHSSKPNYYFFKRIIRRLFFLIRIKELFTKFLTRVRIKKEVGKPKTYLFGSKRFNWRFWRKNQKDWKTLGTF